MRRKIIPNNILIEEVASIITSGEKVVLLTKGASMLPFIVGGRDSVELSPCRGGDITCGTILLAQISNPTRYVIHRVVKVEGEVITLMGDGNINFSEQCHIKHVIARVTAIIKPTRRVDPYTQGELRRARIWGHLLPIRRYLLFIYRLPRRILNKISN